MARESPDALALQLRKLDRNLRVAMRFFGQATGTGDIRPLERAECVYSGLDYGVFNIAFLTQAVESSRELAAILDQCRGYYLQRRVRWSFWLCEELLPPAPRRASRDLFASIGMRPISQAPAMVAAELMPPVRPLPEIDCRPVRDAATRSAFASLTSACFDIPLTVARAVYESEAAWAGDYRGFVGFVRGYPVAMAALVRTEGALGIYSLGASPENRRRGYGEALLRATLAERAPGELLVLESTEAGYPLYRRMGFHDIAKFTVYLVK
ncbi:MAG TPA: GNAT family N-acetyltransferase [Bryobacteraceae bacterium]|nr:GNAT family N-acetyltransferase [Bryobacteraceae bacterium]